MDILLFFIFVQSAHFILFAIRLICYLFINKLTNLVTIHHALVAENFFFVQLPRSRHLPFLDGFWCCGTQSVSTTCQTHVRAREWGVKWKENDFLCCLNIPVIAGSLLLPQWSNISWHCHWWRTRDGAESSDLQTFLHDPILKCMTSNWKSK